MGHVSLPHILIVVAVIVLIFGAPKLPMLARSLGQSLKIFKSEVKDLRDDEPKSTEPGELNSGTGDEPRPTTGGATRSADEKQDPQTHGK
ncbi:sec-independent protein translocase protein TatA [Brevibacterium sanguinis]|uniref:Sec-independent protein translocase protein TatA n=2 Tax=Brevibacterium TaxID=1696 RepID=A0A366IIJ5_9MICO|nr:MULTISPECIES: Sec-independent protein translocase subunit TatA [Brevibacterium]RBP64705.1 sec-independent protein translocase protein TatA [Brevibacterium sanguinis]RBP71652.1 sec-independent protein translocase protein TatA [Brevibacterium celere]